jgi:hypothetical protein
MSTKHIRTAADLVRFKCALKVTCDRCGNARTITGFDVARQFGTMDLGGLARRLKCSLCGAREATLATLSPLPLRN